MLPAGADLPHMDARFVKKFKKIKKHYREGKNKGETGMAISDLHYDAFISYRHSELDKDVAIGIHRRLENFRLPRNIRTDLSKDDRRIKRVFRDQDELPISNNLSDSIEAALRNSDWLILICTPRLPESKWCAREIEIFKKLHGQDHILAILAEGEPEQSFPESIRFREIEVPCPSPEDQGSRKIDDGGEGRKDKAASDVGKFSETKNDINDREADDNLDDMHGREAGNNIDGMNGREADDNLDSMNGRVAGNNIDGMNGREAGDNLDGMNGREARDANDIWNNWTVRNAGDGSAGAQGTLEEVEPLAADVRASSLWKRHKLLDDAVLRIAAVIFDINYDDLKQRHKEQRIRRIAIISSVAAGIFFVFAFCCMILLMKISAQKAIIQQQHGELQAQYALEAEKYAESMSLVSADLMKKGLRKDAIYAIWNAIPSSIEGSQALPSSIEGSQALPSSIEGLKTMSYVASARYALTNALASYGMDMLVPVETIPVPPEEEWDDFWGTSGNYSFLEAYLNGNQLLCAKELDENDGFPEHVAAGSVLLVSSDASLYLYDPENGILNNYSSSWYIEKPDEYLLGAAYHDKTLYLQFSQGDYVACYKWKGHDQYESAGTVTYEDFYDSMSLGGSLLQEGTLYESDDGEYEFLPGTNHVISFFRKSSPDSTDPIRKIYDLRGSFYGLKKLQGTDYYILVGRLSYILDKNLDVIARVWNFYDYSPEKEALILGRVKKNGTEYALHYVPLKSYDELMADAEESLSNYHPSAETMERYRMLK